LFLSRDTSNNREGVSKVMGRDEGNPVAQSVLSSVRVLDFSQVLAGPYCTRLLVDLGAEVIKVEPTPPRVEFSREGKQGLWWLSNCGKKSICLDLTKEESRQIVHELVKECDVVVENFRAGVMSKMGIGYESLREANPRIIFCSLSTYGQDDPKSHLPGSAVVPHALSGYMWVQGKVADQDGPPIGSAFAVGDVSAAVYAATAICSALYYREVSGIGQHIDIALVDSLFSMMSDKGQQLLLDKSEDPKGVRGGSVAIPGKDGHLVIHGLTPEQQKRLLKTMGREDLDTNPGFDNPELMMKHREKLMQAMVDWVQSFDSIQEVMSIVEQADVICAPVLSIWDASRHPHMVAHDMIREIDDPEKGKIKVINTPFRFSNSESGMRGDYPELGEHNREVLQSLLHYSDEKLDQLHEEGIIHSESG
jgi:crotonobetainyl-CoA:carnitine CoA-transferase CaiB-like acyl-CoA transferase